MTLPVNHSNVSIYRNEKLFQEERRERTICPAKKRMKKITVVSASILLLAAAGSFAAPKKQKPVKIGIAKIVQHQALDDVERGVMDAIKDAGIEAEYDLQNANGDVGTAAQIANQF